MDNVKMISEHEAPSSSLCEIRFDCLVKMYETGTRTIKTGFLGMEQKALPPQWFKLEEHITLEGIRGCDEYQLGRRLKEMVNKLDHHIDKYKGWNP